MASPLIIAGAPATAIAQAPLTLGRMPLDSPLHWEEGLGDPIGAQGGAVVPSQRSPMKITTGLATFSSDVTADQVSDRQRVRRQLRALLNNTPLKLAGIYVVWLDDNEQNGWYTPDVAQVADGDGSQSGLTVGYWKIDSLSMMLCGRPRTHRRATYVYLKDTRTGTTPRDFLRNLYSTDFATQAALAVTYLPSQATDVVNTINAQPVTGGARISTIDGGAIVALPGMQDIAVLSYEQTDAARNQGDVVAYDRRGQTLWPPVNASLNEAIDPAFQGATIQWASTGTFLTAGATGPITSSAVSRSGGVSGKITTTAAASHQGAVLMLGVLPAGVHSFGVYAAGAAGGETIEIVAGTAASPATVAATLGTTMGDSSRVIGTFTADGVSPCFIAARTASGAAATLYIDAIMVNQGTTLAAYGDGGLQGWQWTGVPNASPSITIPARPPNAVWEEVYGPDYPFSPSDAPVLENGVCRIRYVPEIGGCFAVEHFTPGSGYVERGRVSVWDSTGATLINTLVQAALLEWTPDRSVIRATFTGSGGLRVDTYITLQRGWSGPRVEVYDRTGTTTAQAALRWTPADAGGWTLNEFANTSRFMVSDDPSASWPNTFTAAPGSPEPWLGLLPTNAQLPAVALGLQQALVDTGRVDDTAIYPVGGFLGQAGTRKAVQVREQSGSYIGYLSLTIGMSLSGNIFSAAPAYEPVLDDFSTDTIASGKWAFDAAGTASISGGALSSTAADTLYRVGLSLADEEVSFKFTMPAPTGVLVGPCTARLDAANHLTGMLGTTGSSAAVLYIFKKDGGTYTQLAVTAGFAITPGNPYWLVMRTVANLIALELWSTDPRLGGAPAQTLSYTLAGANATKFGAGVYGQPGIYTSGGPVVIDDFCASPFPYVTGGVTPGSGTGRTADANAYGGLSGTSTRSADAAHTSITGMQPGKYSTWARVRVAGGTLSVYAKTPATTGATQTTGSSTYVWLALGEITVAASTDTVELHAWAGGAALFVDRITLVPLERRQTALQDFNGIRDHGQARLYDSRSEQALVTR